MMSYEDNLLYTMQLCMVLSDVAFKTSFNALPERSPHFSCITSTRYDIDLPVLVVFGAPNEKPVEDDNAGVPKVKVGAVVFATAPNNPVPSDEFVANVILLYYRVPTMYLEILIKRVN